MDSNNLDTSPDENCILQYLMSFPGEFITAMEIARRADGRSRFQKDVRWAHIALQRLAELKLIELDGEGKVRLNNGRDASAPGKSATKFIDPRLRAILERSGRNIDLSDYA